MTKLFYKSTMSDNVQTFFFFFLISLFPYLHQCLGINPDRMINSRETQQFISFYTKWSKARHRCQFFKLLKRTCLKLFHTTQNRLLPLPVIVLSINYLFIYLSCVTTFVPLTVFYNVQWWVSASAMCRNVSASGQSSVWAAGVRSMSGWHCRVFWFMGRTENLLKCESGRATVVFLGKLVDKLAQK